MGCSTPPTSTSWRPQHNGIKCGGHTQQGPQPPRSLNSGGPQHPRTPQHLRPQPPGGLNLVEASTSAASTSRRPQHGGLNIPDGLNTGASTVSRYLNQHPRRPQHRRPQPSGSLNIGGLNLPQASIQWYQPSGGLNSGSPHDGGLNLHGGLNIGGLNLVEASASGASTSRMASTRRPQQYRPIDGGPTIHDRGPQYWRPHPPGGLNMGASTSPMA